MKPSFLNPICYEEVCFATDLAIPVRGKDKLLAVACEHWKAIERLIECHPFQPSPIDVDDIKVKVSPFWIGQVGRKDDPLVVRMEERAKIGCTVVRHLTLV